MNRLRSPKPSPAMVVAIVALVAAVAGTAIATPIAINSALNKQEKKQTKKIAKSQANKAISKRAPGLSVAKANTANSANTADSANNADAVGGTALSGLLRVNGCQTGKVRGFARVLGAAGMPNTFTTSASFVANAGTCSGQSVEVRRISTGVYRVRFNGVATDLAVASGGGLDASVTTVKISGESSFEARVVNPVTDALVDTTFTIMTF